MFVYILTNANDSVLYIGVTNNLVRRLDEHRRGTADGFTKKYQCTKLIYYEQGENIMSALEREKQLKNWSRTKKEWLIAIMNPRWQDLSSQIVDHDD